MGKESEKNSMEPFTEISLVETAITKCHLIQTPAGFDLSYAHGHLLLAYAPEEAFNEIAITYENRRITMELNTAFLLLDSLKDHGPA